MAFQYLIFKYRLYIHKFEGFGEYSKTHVLIYHLTNNYDGNERYSINSLELHILISRMIEVHSSGLDGLTNNKTEILLKT